ncbi:hypothetical protein [Kribbella sp. NPDC004536]|uniref:hypothetical protein n=1 Tax=Kribbella sp. NPDC004536 TaxID=3364106 RepID=UPI00367FB97A
MPRRSRMRRAAVVVVVVAVLTALADCGTPAPSGPVTKPVGLIAIGHSGLTGRGTAHPEEDALQYSWATGTSPNVNSIYLRLVKLRPQDKGHVANTAVDGATASSLDGEAELALQQVSAPALVIISIIGNDIRCDGTDDQHIPEFGQDVSAALDTITKKSPDSRILVVGQMGRPDPALARAIVAHDPNAKYTVTGSGICSFYDVTGALVPSHFKTLTAITEAYEAEQARVCAKYPQCHTDGGAREAYKDKLENFAPDWMHHNITGQTQEAAITWPAVEKALGL